MGTGASQMCNATVPAPASDVSLSSSVQHSETTVDPFKFPEEAGKRRFWGDNGIQKAMHNRFSSERQTVAFHLSTSPNPNLAKRLTRIDACCVAPMIVLRTNGKLGISPGFCRDRMCPSCQWHRGRELERKVFKVVSAMDYPRFITLTLKHSDDGLSDQITRLYESFRRLRQQKGWKAHVRMGVATLEVTRQLRDGRWHPHLHILYDGEFYNVATLKAGWEVATGDSSIVFIKVPHGREQASAYIARYLGKPVDLYEWPPAATCEYALALAGRRLLMAFGKKVKYAAEPENLGQTTEKCQVLAPSQAVVDAVRRGCPYGGLARALLERLGGFFARAVGCGGPKAVLGGEPLTEAETAELLVALRRCRGDDTAWLPSLEPARRFNGVTHAGHRPKDATMRLFTGF